LDGGNGAETLERRAEGHSPLFCRWTVVGKLKARDNRLLRFRGARRARRWVLPGFVGGVDPISTERVITLTKRGGPGCWRGGCEAKKRGWKKSVLRAPAGLVASQPAGRGGFELRRLRKWGGR